MWITSNQHPKRILVGIEITKTSILIDKPYESQDLLLIHSCIKVGDQPNILLLLPLHMKITISKFKICIRKHI